jgi:probable F420-dependent oxidoreductase
MQARAAKPMRFGLITAGTTPDTLLDAAREADRAGFSTIALNDHLSSTLAPLLGLQAMAAATSTVRLATAVLNQDFRHPAVLAKELATLDVLSGGRLEVGLGAGWMGGDYTESGIPFDKASRRIARLEEYIRILKQLFTEGACSLAGTHFTIADLKTGPAPTQPGGPPILVGGGGRKVLSMAARCADIVQVLGAPLGGEDSSPTRSEAYEERLGWIADAAGDRLSAIELSVMLSFVAVTDDAEQSARKHLDRAARRTGADVSHADVTSFLQSPVVAVGTHEEVCDKLTRVRDTLGFSYFVMPWGAKPEKLAPIVEQLTRA